MTDRQKRFVEEYLIDLNATQAAIRAGYSPNNADKIGNELLGKTRVSAAIAKAIAQRSKRTGISQDRVVRELAKIAFVKMTDVVNKDGEIINDASDDDLSCIESIKYKHTDSKNGNTKEREVKIASKLKALELLGKHLGMFDNRINLEDVKDDGFLEALEGKVSSIWESE